MVAPFVDRLLPWLAQADKKSKRAAKAAKNGQPAKQKAEAPAAAPPRKKDKERRADKAAAGAAAGAAPAAATLQVLQRPEGAALKRPPRGHAFLDFEFKTHAVLAALD